MFRFNKKKKMISITFEGGDGAKSPEVFYNEDDKALVQITPVITNISSVVSSSGFNGFILKTETTPIDKIEITLNGSTTVIDYTNVLNLTLSPNVINTLSITYINSNGTRSKTAEYSFMYAIPSFYQIEVRVTRSSTGTSEFSTPMTFNVYDNDNNVYTFVKATYNNMNYSSASTTFADKNGNTYVNSFSKTTNNRIDPNTSLPPTNSYNAESVITNNTFTWVYKGANYSSSGSVQETNLIFYLNNANMFVKGFSLTFNQNTIMNPLVVRVYKATKADLSDKVLIKEESYRPSNNTSKTVSDGI